MLLFVLLLLLATPAMAQQAAGHAVLVLPSESMRSDAGRALRDLGGRVAVLHRRLIVVRIDADADAPLIAALPGSVVLRSPGDIERHSAAVASERHLLEALLAAPEYSPADAGNEDFSCSRGEGKHADGCGDGSDGCGDGSDGCGDGSDGCLVFEEDSDPAMVREAMRNSHAFAFNDPNKTSDVLVGSTTVAVFCVNNVLAQQQGVPTWTETIRANAPANIVRNLAWWSDQAAAYGITKSFTIREYAPDHPACAIDFDPTEGYTQTSFSINDHKFQNPIMNALGYSGASQSVKMRAFCNDLRLDEGTDWAYITFLLVGRHTVRAHASFGGPSTVLMANSAANGWVYAHETGHIFNAFDEYFESPASNSRSRQSRFGVPNGNHHFRNHPVQPCIMAYNYRALSGYTAVHLGLAEHVRKVMVETVPADAIFEVEYLDPEGRASNISRHQGATSFAWGNGTRVRLRGLPSVSSGGVLYEHAQWNPGGGTEYLLDVDDEVPTLITIEYTSTAREAAYSFEYLTLGNALASEFVQDILPLGSRTAAFAGQKGIAIWDDGSRSILDHPIAGRGLPMFRESYSIARAADNTLYFGSQSSEILGWNELGIFTLTGPVADMTYRNLTVTTDATVWATDGGVSGGRDMQASGLHRFRDGQATVFTAETSPLPSNSIVALAPAGPSAVWVGLGGKDTKDQGLFVFDADALSVTDHSALLPAPSVQRLRPLGGDSLLVLSRGGGTPGLDTRVSLIHGGSVEHWDAGMLGQLGAINDATLDGEGRLVVVSTQGVSILHDGTWQRFRTSDSEVMSNIFYSVTRMPDGAIIAGSNSGAVRISPAAQVTTLRPVTSAPSTVRLHDVYPQPLSGAGTVTVSFDRPQSATLRVHDLHGRVVADIAGGFHSTGTYHFTVPAGLSPGVYFLQLVSGEVVRRARFIVM